MKRAFLVLAVTALALPASALGKGPSEAVITGPGGGGGGSELTFTGCCASETPTMMLAERAGFFPAVFGQEPNPMLAGRPKGDLGPRFTITYTVPNPNNGIDEITQDLYPYAKGGPVTYTKPGQRIVDMAIARGGWFQDARLKETLVAAGLPSRPTPAGSGGTALSTNLFSAFAVALFLVAATAVFLRRRMKPAARMAGSPS